MHRRRNTQLVIESLGLFAKYWQPGKVKTRLAATIGPQKAADAYRHFVVTLLKRFSCCCDQKWLAITPPERAQEFREVVPAGWQLESQAEGNLGDRMQAFFARRFAAGSQRVVLLGTDSPQVPVAYIQQAFERLRHVPVVLGPTEDGGYWLVGAAGGVPDIFSEIPWSTPQVWQATLKALHAAKISHATLPICYDIDNKHDLQRLICELQDHVGCDPQLDRLLELLG